MASGSEREEEERWHGMEHCSTSHLWGKGGREGVSRDGEGCGGGGGPVRLVLVMTDASGGDGGARGSKLVVAGWVVQ